MLKQPVQNEYVQDQSMPCYYVCPMHHNIMVRCLRVYIEQADISLHLHKMSKVENIQHIDCIIHIVSIIDTFTFVPMQGMLLCRTCFGDDWIPKAGRGQGHSPDYFGNIMYQYQKSRFVNNKKSQISVRHMTDRQL